MPLFLLDRPFALIEGHAPFVDGCNRMGSCFEEMSPHYLRCYGQRLRRYVRIRRYKI